MESADPADTPAVARLRAEFAPVRGYLNAATAGLPPRRVVEAMTADLQRWQAAQTSPAGYDEVFNRARALFAELVGVPAAQVALHSQTSVVAGMVAASLPDGARVLCVEGDFSSVVFPFLAQADRRIVVDQVAPQALAESVRPEHDLVAFSLALSACGSIVDHEAVVAACADTGALTFADLTQAAGWMPVDAGAFDLTVTSAYKWLCQPRGTVYLTAKPEAAARVRPVNAGWYAGEDIWGSCYGPQMHLAADARRLEVSPAWPLWVGAVAAMETLALAPVEEVGAHDARLADALRERLGLEPCGRPVLALPDADGSVAARLEQAGVQAASRAGRVRLALHIWNDLDDVDLVAEALTGGAEVPGVAEAADAPGASLTLAADRA